MNEQEENRQPDNAPNGLGTPLYWMLASSLLLVIPTLCLLFSAPSDTFIARHITDAWHGGMAHALQAFGVSLPTKAVSIIMDGLTWLCIAGMAFGYFRLLRQKKTPRLAGRDLFLLGCIGIVLLLVIPFHSRDIYGYINRGVQQAFYGANPYMTPVGEMPDWQAEPMFTAHWLDNPCPYGFSYAKIAKWLTVLGGHMFFPTFLIFKFSTLLVHVLNAYLVYRLALALSRQNPLHLGLLYGLNPLILMHQLANGHNDGFLALGLLASLLVLWQAKEKALAWPLLLLSILTKHASLLASPFMIVATVKERRFASLLTGLALTALLLGVLSWPYVQDWQHLPYDKMGENASLSQHSIQSGIARLLFYTAGPFVPDKHAFLEMLRLALKKTAFLAFAVFYSWRIWRFTRHAPSENGSPQAVAEKQLPQAPSASASSLMTPLLKDALLFEIVLAMGSYLLIASAKFHAWYLGMVLPFAFLLNPALPMHRHLSLILFWVSIFQLLSFTPLENIHVLGVLTLTALPTLLALRHPRFQFPFGN